MASKVLLITTIVALVYSQASAQFFGGVQNFPGGGRSQQAGYRVGPAWGSLSQSFDHRGFSSPITVGAGGNYLSPQGHGLSGSVSMIPGVGGQGNLRGQVGIVNNPGHQVTAFGQHDRFLDRNLRPIGPETNSLGVNYLNKNSGANAFLSGSQTNGQPARGTVGGSIPIVNKGNTVVGVTGQTTFGHGMKPDHQVGVQVSTSF